MISTGRWIALIASVALLALAATIGMRGPPGDTPAVAAGKFVPSQSPSTSLRDAMPASSEARIRAALQEVCVNTTPDSANDNWNPGETQADVEAFSNLKRTLSKRLSVSSSAEHLHLAALLERESMSRIDLIDQAVALTPSDAFVLWGAVHICAEEREASDCPLRVWEERLLQVDGQNSESWIRVAANRFEAGEPDGALAALRHAAAAAETRAYWTETIEMVERGFAAGSDYAFSERAGLAFGFAASELPNYRDYVTMCKEQSAKDADWAYACLAYGELVESQGRTDMGVSSARSIQKLALEVLGDEEKLAAVIQRQETHRAHRQEMRDSVGEDGAAAERLLFSNPALFFAYLAAVRTHGESGARFYVAKEASRLLQEQPELACLR